MVIAFFVFRSHFGMEVFYPEIIYLVLFVSQLDIDLTIGTQSVLILKYLPFDLPVTVPAPVVEFVPGVAGDNAACSESVIPVLPDFFAPVSYVAPPFP